MACAEHAQLLSLSLSLTLSIDRQLDRSLAHTATERAVSSSAERRLCKGSAKGKEMRRSRSPLCERMAAVDEFARGI